MIVSKYEKLNGLKLLLLIIPLGVGYVDVLSNVSGHSIMTPYIAGSLEGVTPSFSAWGTTIYLIGVALGVSLSKYLTGVFGEYRVLTYGYLLYAALSFTCSLSPTVYAYAPMRFIFGSAGGILAITSQTVALNELPEDKYKLGLGYWSELGMMPYTLAVFLGGFWAEYFNWRWLFYANATIGVSISLLVGALLYGRNYEQKIVDFDYIGFILFAISIVSLQLILSQGNDFDWFGSPWLTILLLIAVFCVPTFVIWEWGEAHPLIDVKLFSKSTYFLGCLFGFLGFFVVQGIMSLMSVQMQLLLGYSSSTAGEIYLVMMLAGLPLAGFMYEISKLLDVRFVVSLMFICSSITLTWLGLYDKSASFDALPIPVIFLGLCVAALSAPLSTLATYGLSGAFYKRAAQEFLVFRLIGGAMGIAFQSVIYFRRTPFHQLDLADFLGGRRFASYDSLGQLQSKLQNLGISDSVISRLIARLIRQQSGILAMNDAFLLGGFILFVCAVAVWLAKLNTKTSALHTDNSISSASH
jgi:DHA2 family multidrug resistance protein